MLEAHTSSLVLADADMVFFDKPIADLSVEDIQWLVASGVQEGGDIDFKRTLSTRDGASDRWITKGDEVGGDAKRTIVKELVGFANAQGGSLILGIEETEDKPPRAAKIAPIPKVVDLADRLKRACRDLIEPIVHSIEAVGIPTDQNGEGVVVLRVPSASPFGPHRSRADKECYLRRNDETIPMSMDEIQRRVLDMSARLERTDEQFRANAEEFSRGLIVGWRMRILALPLAPLNVPNVHRVLPARPAAQVISIRFPKQTADANMLEFGPDWRPIIRGSKCRTAHGQGHSAVTINDNGHILFHWEMPSKPDGPNRIPLEWFPGFFGNALLAIERMRLAAKTPSMEYALEYRLAVDVRPHTIGPYADGYGRVLGTIEPGVHLLGKYPVNRSDDLMR
jgi:schlafen family protein